MKLFRKEDGGWYGWMVVFASFLSKCVIVGSSGIGMGVFLVAFLEYFGEGTGKTALFQALSTAMMTLPSPLVSILNNRFGTRPLVIIGGVISSVAIFLSSFANSINVLLLTFCVTGMAFSLTCGPSIVIVGQYCHKRHALANGIVYAGNSVGMMVFPPLHHKLIETYGWRGAMIVMAGINLNVVVCGMLMRPPLKVHIRIDEDNLTKNTKDDTNITSEHVLLGVESDPDEKYNEESTCYKTRQYSDSQINTEYIDSGVMEKPMSLRRKVSEHLGTHLFTNNWFCTLSICILITNMGKLAIFVHFVNKAVTSGIPVREASFLMTVLGIGSLIGRITHGWFVDLGYHSPMFFAACAATVAGTSAALVAIANGNYAVHVFIAALYGVSSGIHSPLNGPVSLKICVGVQHLSSAFGWYLFYAGIGNLCGPPLADSKVHREITTEITLFIKKASIIAPKTRP
uniref:Monocarboxylate transporter 9-like n=1 Tax=Saccoglossus kowalevskii TaxID=10224 RepID=A0ABM0H1B0_SACKO|nr:PREDICTED: monocarboxylate transporter 9-like [Saccoglossus kowalevskii]